jgi:hypothetical protein
VLKILSKLAARLAARYLLTGRHCVFPKRFCRSSTGRGENRFSRSIICSRPSWFLDRNGYSQQWPGFINIRAPRKGAEAAFGARGVDALSDFFKGYLPLSPS